ncbi:MAG: AlwI family type II restriction endonuclease [Bacillota bacterium]
MAKKYNIVFRTKPRSPQPGIKWLDKFLEFEGQNFDLKNDDGSYPIREAYTKLAKPNEDLNPKDLDADARQQKAYCEHLGFAYVDDKGIIHSTKAGREIVSKENKRDELMLRQLLKVQYPNFINGNKQYKHMDVFLMDVVLQMLNELGYLNRYEAAISLMLCIDKDNIDKAINIVKEFRKLAEKEPVKDNKNMEKIMDKLKKDYYPEIIDDLNENDSYLTTVDAIFRHLEYTSLFIQSGRSNFTKISVREMAKERVDLLRKEYEFEFNPDYDTVEFFNKFGDPYFKSLPWDQKENLYDIIINDLKNIKAAISEYEIKSDNSYYEKVEGLISEVNANRRNSKNLKSISDEVRELIVSVNEDIYINITSKTEDKRTEIIEKFDDILDGKSSGESLALWFENITWKSLVALQGTHNVKRNFKVEPDLSPRFFAPGVGNTPDTEFYNDEYVIITEVTLTQGAQQWKAEGSSVIDHINSFFDVKFGETKDEKKGEVIKEDEREIIGLFLAKKIHNRVLWWFYALNNDSWISQPMPVIPLTIEEYVLILEKFYSENIESIYFERFLWVLHREAKASDNFKEWEKNIKKKIKSFLENPKDFIKFNY